MHGSVALWLGLLELFIKTHPSNLGHPNVPRDRPRIIDNPLETAAHRQHLTPRALSIRLRDFTRPESCLKSVEREGVSELGPDQVL